MSRERLTNQGERALRVVRMLEAEARAEAERSRRYEEERMRFFATWSDPYWRSAFARGEAKNLY